MSVRASANGLAFAHWDTFVSIIIELHGEENNVREKCGIYFRKGFILGFEYGVSTKEGDNRVLQEIHWKTEKAVMTNRGEEPEVIRKCGVHHRLAFIHGFKHGREARELFLR